MKDESDHLLERTSVANAISEDLAALQLPAETDDIRKRIAENAQEIVVCVDEDSRYLGMLSSDRLDEGFSDGADLMSLLDRDVSPLLATESLDDAFAAMAPRGLRILPVVENLVYKRVIGVVTRETLASAYWKAVAMSRADT